MPTTLTGVLLETQYQIVGSYPDVPLAAGVEYATLVAGDDDPVFVTLPVGAVDTESRNGRRYDRAAVEAIVHAINTERSIGQKGHLRDDERAYRFDVPPLVWVGAKLEGDGRAWAKAYVLKTAPDVREYVRVAKASNAKVGTSIYGTADIDTDGNVSNLQIESIDLAHPGRLGVPMAGAVPQITQETETPEIQAETEETVPTEQMTLEATPAQIVEITRAHQAQVRELEGKVADLEGRVNDLAQIAEMLGVDDAISGVRIVQQQVSNLRRENGDLLEEAITAQVTEAVAVENVRPILVEMVRNRKPATRQAVSDAVAAVLAQEAVKALLKDAVGETMGPAQQRPVMPQQAETDQPWIIIPGKGA